MEKCDLEITTIQANIENKNIKNDINNYILNIETKNLKSNNNFIKNLISNYGFSSFMTFIETNLSSKIIHFIRHGLAEHNYYKKNKNLFEVKPTFFDPDLVEDGVEKLKKVKKEMIKKELKYDLVMVSPMRRTLKTLMILKEKDTAKKEQTRNTINEEVNKVYNSILESIENQQNHIEELVLKFYF